MCFSSSIDLKYFSDAGFFTTANDEQYMQSEVKDFSKGLPLCEGFVIHN